MKTYQMKIKPSPESMAQLSKDGKRQGQARPTPPTKIGKQSAIKPPPPKK